VPWTVFEEDYVFMLGPVLKPVWPGKSLCKGEGDGTGSAVLHQVYGLGSFRSKENICL
jgi:hypothetical protein